MTVKITDLDPTGGLEDSDLMVTKKGTQDYKATLSELSEYIINNLEPQEVMDLIKLVDTDVSGLNATTLSGTSLAYLLSANSIQTGIINDDRLPSGDYNSSISTGASRTVLDLPEFLVGQPIRIEFGHTALYSGLSATQTHTFRTPFSGGFVTNPNSAPLVVAAPMSYSAESGESGQEEIEKDSRMISANLSNFTWAAIRTQGSDSSGNRDWTRMQYIAIGTY